MGEGLYFVEFCPLDAKFLFVFPKVIFYLL